MSSVSASSVSPDAPRGGLESVVTSASRVFRSFGNMVASRPPSESDFPRPLPRSSGSAPMSTVMQSPGNGDYFDPQVFNTAGSRASDKPGSAVSSARPRSFSRQKAARTSRVTTYLDDDNEEEKMEAGPSAAAVQAAKAAVATSRAATHHDHPSKTYSETSGSECSNLSASGTGGGPRRSFRVDQSFSRGSGRGFSAQPTPGGLESSGGRAHYQPVDPVGVGISLRPVDVGSMGLATSTSTALESVTSTRAVAGSGPITRGYSVRATGGSGGTLPVSGFDDAREDDPLSLGRPRPVPKRRSSTPNLMAASAVTRESHYGNLTSIGTPSSLVEGGTGGNARSSGRDYRRAASVNRITPGTTRSLDPRGKRKSTTDGTSGTPATVRTRPPQNLREAISAGSVLDVGKFVRAMSDEQAEVDLVAKDREHGTPLMQAAAGKSAPTYRAVMDAIKTRLGKETLMSELQERDLRAWNPLMHASWSGSEDVFRAVVVSIEDTLGRDQVAEQLSSTAKYGWTPLHAAARGNAEAMGAVMNALVNYMEADELKEQLSQSHDRDSDLPTPLMFAAASNTLDSRSLSPLLTELLGSMCDIDEARRQRTAVDYSATYGRLDTLSCLIAFGCSMSDQTVTTLLSGDHAVGAAAFNKCIWRGITTARNPFIPAYNVLRAIGRAADRDAKHRQFLLRMQDDIVELVHELLQKLPASVAGFADNQLDAGQGFAAVQWILEPEMAGKRIPTFAGPLARALETRRLEFFQSDLVLAYVSRKFSRGLPGMFSGASWRMPDMHNPDTKRFVLCLPYGAAPDNIVGAIRLRLFVPFELIQGSALRQTSLLPGLQFNCVGLASRPDAFYEVPSVRMAFEVVTYVAMIVLFCFVVKLDSPTDIPAQEIAFYSYMLGMMVNELGEARYLRKLRGQSELWNVVEAILLGLILAAFTARMIALGAESIREEAFFLAQLFLAIAAPLLFSRVLFLAQIDENLGLMVQIMFRMMKEVMRFGVVIGVVLLGFAMAMYALFGGRPDELGDDSSTSSSSAGRGETDSSGTTGVLGLDPFPRWLQEATETDEQYDYISEVYLPSFTTYSESALTLFRAMFGDFYMDEFFGVRYGYAGIGLMVAFLTIMGIMLLNLLIAFLTGAHADVQKHARAKFYFTRTQIVQHWDRVVEHDVLPSPINLLHRSLCLALKVFVARRRYPSVKTRIGCFLFWLVMGPLGAAIAIGIWVISMPWTIWALFVGGQPSKEVDRRSEKLKYLVTAPGLLLIALMLGFLTVFVGDGSSDAAKAARNARKDKLQRGGDYDVAGKLRQLAHIGVDDLRRQLRNPLKDSQVLPRDAKLGTTVEHVKQLRDDIASTTSQTLKDHSRAAQKTADERATRIEARLSALELSVTKAVTLMETVIGNARGVGTSTVPTSASTGSTVSGPRSVGSHIGSHNSQVFGE